MRSPCFITGLLCLGLLAGCSLFEQPPVARGNRIDADLLKEMVPGTSSRADALALLGSPTAHASFDDNTWLYVGSMTRPVIASTNVILSQEVVMLTFDGKGTLRDIRRLDDKDRLPVEIVSRTTPSPGSDASILQQLFGNIGKFSTGGLGGAASQDQPPSGGIPNRPQ